MSPASERYARVSELFQAAVEFSLQDRAALLEAECGGDKSLRGEIEALLEADAQSDGFIAQPISAIPADLLEEEEFAGREFGAYRVVREIGRGGLGAVYLAARADEQFQKQVAIKVVKRGLDTDDILQRFRSERQILAQLEHPNIARLIDAGSTEEGLPYFVMEYVEGEAISSYCETHKHSTTDRLNLFRLVCSAVTYAHQHLVIHRDIKPSNILVTADGMPKLLDFGIAKVLHADDPLAALTMTGVRVMTPEYASPEQVRGLPITTSTDIYSLGVLLYELLTGRKPYRLTTHTPEELSRAVIDQIPERPSTAVTGNLKSQVPNPNLRGDLDNIVLMALRKEPERRYPSVEQFSEDIRRHLEGRPVLAHKDTVSYRAGKFIKRHRAGVAAAVMIVLALLGGMIGTLWQAGVARAEKARAEKRFNDVRKLANSNLFEVYPEVENLEGSLRAREAILRNALSYLDSLANEAQGDSELQSELATAYEKVGDVQGALNISSLGNTKAALDSYVKAGMLRAAVLEEHPQDLNAKKSLANNYYITARTVWYTNQLRDAEQAFDRAVKIQRELVAAKPDAVEYKNRLAVVLIDYAAIPVFNVQIQKAQVLFNEALEIIRRLQEQDPGNSDLKKTRARALRILGKARSGFGDYSGGLEALGEALAISKDLARQFPQDFRVQRTVWLTESVTCELYIDKRDAEQVVPSCLQTIEFPKAALEKEPENGVIGYDLAISHFNTARAFGLAQQPESAIEQAERAIEVMSVLSRKSPNEAEYKRNLALYRTTLARAQIELGRFDAAISVLQEVRDTLRPILEADPIVTMHQYDLGMATRLAAAAFHKKGEKGKAIELIDEALAVFAKLRDLNALRDPDKDVLAELEREKSEYLSP